MYTYIDMCSLRNHARTLELHHLIVQRLAHHVGALAVPLQAGELPAHILVGVIFGSDVTSSGAAATVYIYKYTNTTPIP